MKIRPCEGSLEFLLQFLCCKAHWGAACRLREQIASAMSGAVGALTGCINDCACARSKNGLTAAECRSRRLGCDVPRESGIICSWIKSVDPHPRAFRALVMSRLQPASSSQTRLCGSFQGCLVCISSASSVDGKSALPDSRAALECHGVCSGSSQCEGFPN